MEPIVLSASYSRTLDNKSSHFHDCHQLLYIQDGLVSVTVSGQCYAAGPGTLILISRFEQHSIQVKSDTYCRYNLQISPNIHQLSDSQLFSILINRPDSFYHAWNLSQYPEAERLFAQLLDEHQQNSPLKNTMVHSLFVQLLILLYRAYPELLPQANAHLSLVQKLQTYLEAHAAQAITLEQLSQHFHVSQSHLSHIFKQVTGTSVMGYLQSCRLAAAKRFLTETDLTVSQIIEQCGFTDNSNFSRTFKSETGLTPSAFRKTHENTA